LALISAGEFARPVRTIGSISGHGFPTSVQNHEVLHLPRKTWFDFGQESVNPSAGGDTALSVEIEPLFNPLPHSLLSPLLETLAETSSKPAPSPSKENHKLAKKSGPNP
jgi:hypothetical protein